MTDRFEEKIERLVDLLSEAREIAGSMPASAPMVALHTNIISSLAVAEFLERKAYIITTD